MYDSYVTSAPAGISIYPTYLAVIPILALYVPSVIVVAAAYASVVVPSCSSVLATVVMATMNYLPSTRKLVPAGIRTVGVDMVMVSSPFAVPPCLRVMK